MILNPRKFGFLFLAIASLLFVTPVKKVIAQEQYMFCAIDRNGWPASSHCDYTLDACQRLASDPMLRGNVICVARPKTQDMLNK